MYKILYWVHPLFQNSRFSCITNKWDHDIAKVTSTVSPASSFVVLVFLHISHIAHCFLSQRIFLSLFENFPFQFTKEDKLVGKDFCPGFVLTLLYLPLWETLKALALFVLKEQQPVSCLYHETISLCAIKQYSRFSSKSVLVAKSRRLTDLAIISNAL